MDDIHIIYHLMEIDRRYGHISRLTADPVVQLLPLALSAVGPRLSPITMKITNG